MQIGISLSLTRPLFKGVGGTPANALVLNGQTLTLNGQTLTLGAS